MTGTTPLKITYLKDYRAPSYQMDSVHLFFDLLASHTDLTTTVRYSLVDGAEPKLELAGNAENFELLEVAMNGVVLGTSQFQRSAESLVLNNLPSSFELVIKTRLRPEENKSFMGLYKSQTLYCTQMEAEGFRTMTYFLDRPDALGVYTTVIDADRGLFPVLLSNGNLVESKDLGNGRHRVAWHDPFPKPSYLFALVAGNLELLQDFFVTRSGKKVELRIYTESGQIDRCHFAMDALKRSMKWDEERFGREYDLELFMIVAVRDFNFGAMENKGLNIFSSSTLFARPDTTTDERFDVVEAIVAHEYFHNWSGNRVTCRNWFQLCLKEGLTVFRDQEFSADMGSRGLKRVQDVSHLRSTQFPEDAGPLAHAVRPESFATIDNFYTPTIYEKGAELIRMLTHLLGWEVFRKGCDLYFERFDGCAVQIENFIECMSQVSGRSLDQFMLWYSQAGTPQLRLEKSFGPSGELELHLSQHTPPSPGQSEKMPLHMPFKVAFLDPTSGLELHERILEVTQAQETFAFPDVLPSAVISPLREFTAPVDLKWNPSDAELETLIRYDRDPFNSWEAWQIYFKNEFGRVLSSGSIAESATKLASILVSALSMHKADPAFAAELLHIPSLLALQQAFSSKFSFDQVVGCRQALLREMALAKYESFVEIWSVNAQAEGVGVSEDKGSRALKNAALAFAAYSENPALLGEILSRQSQAKNMTDEIALSQILNRRAGDLRDRSNQEFYNRWKQEPLVIDMWLKSRNLCQDEAYLEELRGLSKSDLGQSLNPSRNRAIYTAFAKSSPALFHHKSGEGYVLMAQRIAEIDSFNPQLAARIAETFSDVSLMDQKRKDLALAQLQPMAQQEMSSKNLREILGKIVSALEGSICQV